MKKSTALVILIIYLVSIVLIGFFGMAVKAYDLQKYIKTIEMSVEAEKESMYKFESMGKDINEDGSGTHNNVYKLIIYFSEALVDENQQQYLPLTLIPKVTYDTGDVNAKGDSIKYTTNKEAKEYIDNDYINLDERGILTVYKKRISFDIFVNPSSVGKIGSGAIIHVYVR